MIQSVPENMFALLDQLMSAFDILSDLGSHVEPKLVIITDR